MAPAISILMPVRDAEATLEDTLASIFAQTWADYELIAVDDHSRDGSARLLRRQADQDSRLQVLRAEGRGLVAALNQGLAACRSDLVARMDADDLMHPQRLALQFAALQAEPQLALHATQVRAFPDEQVQAGYREYLRWQNTCLSHTQIAEQRFVESPVAHPSVMFRRGAVMAVGGYRQGDFPEDYELWLRMLSQGMSMAKLDRVLLDWRERGDRTSRVDHRYARSAFDQLRAEYLALHIREHWPASRPLWIWGAGRRTRQRVRRLFEQGVEAQALIDIDPGKIGRCYHGLPVCAPEALSEQSLSSAPPRVLIYVTNHGAREQIESYLRGIHYHRGEDYFAVG